MSEQASKEPTDAAPVSGRIVVTGGTGFVGGNLRATLAGRSLRLLVRSREKYAKLASDQVDLVEGDVTEPESLRGAMEGCEAVIHLVAVIAEEGGVTFDRVIHQGTKHVVEEAKRAGIRRFIFMSALGAQDNPRYPYLRAKWQAEQIVKASGIPWTIIRPSVIFGPGDEFINALAGVVRNFPVIPVVGSGESKFQPIAASEVAEVYQRTLDDPSTAGEVYEIGGGETYTYEEMLDLIARKLGKRKRKAHVPVSLMMPVVKLSKPLPRALRPPVTDEQLKMLALDNCTEDSATAKLIGRAPMSLKDGIDYIASS